MPRPPAEVVAHRVEDAAQARLLTDPRHLTTFRVFLAREATVTDAVEQTGVDMNATLYRIRNLLGAGLLEVVRVLPRKGRGIKVYRSQHDAYFVPYALTPFATLEERLLAQSLPELRERTAMLARRLQQDGREGQRLFRDETGDTWVMGARDEATEPAWPDPGSGVGTDYWTDLELTDEEAREVQAALLGLLNANSRAPGHAAADPPAGAAGRERGASRRARPYRLLVAFVPLDD